MARLSRQELKTIIKNDWFISKRNMGRKKCNTSDIHICNNLNIAITLSDSSNRPVVDN